MHGGALAQKASKQKELSDHKLVKASNKRHGGGYSACALDIYIYIYTYIYIRLSLSLYICILSLMISYVSLQVHG